MYSKPRGCLRGRLKLTRPGSFLSQGIVDVLDCGHVWWFPLPFLVVTASIHWPSGDALANLILQWYFSGFVCACASLLQDRSPALHFLPNLLFPAPSLHTAWISPSHPYLSSAYFVCREMGCTISLKLHLTGQLMPIDVCRAVVRQRLKDPRKKERRMEGRERN
ncbi:hypothetical protein O3P69_003718 [Scylla paramamosain]|uniref:Uncharacterized protein n=1 Tax=Scylla paramamosain TaxID=85552 RepID=A0AAW0UEI7_SCYPA